MKINEEKLAVELNLVLLAIGWKRQTRELEVLVFAEHVNAVTHPDNAIVLRKEIDAELSFVSVHFGLASIAEREAIQRRSGEKSRSYVCSVFHGSCAGSRMPVS